MYRDMIALICMTIGVILFILGVMLFERLLYRMEPSSPKWRWLLCLTWLPMIVFSIGSVILAGEHHVGYGVLAIGAYYLTQQWREVLFFLLYPYHKEFHQ